MRVSFQFKKGKINQLGLAALLVSLAITSPTVGKDGYVNSLSSNPRISFYVETDQGVPQYVSGKLADGASPGSKVSPTIAYFEKHKIAYKMSDPQKELVVKRIEEDKFGNHHLRFDQYYKGLKVIGGNLISHFNSDGELKTVNGFYQAEIDLDVNPTVSSFEAIDISLADLADNFGAADPQQPELVVFPWLGEYFLCWHLFLLSDYPLARWEYFVDAKTGEIVFSMNRIMSSCEIGTGYSVLNEPRNHIDVWYTGVNYEMRDYTRQLNNNIHGHNGQMPDGNYIQTNIAGAEFPGPVATDDDNIWHTVEQTPAVDAHVYAGLFYDWLLREFGRNSFDNNGSSMISSVNWTGQRNGGFWTGSQTVFLIWQTGTRSWAGCPDVVAHEWSHAISDYGAVLVYTWESGAINEAFSDMMGAAFEFAHDTLDDPDWYIAENGYFPSAASMSDPESRGRPSYYKGPYWVYSEYCIPTQDNDFCGVHINCGVGHKWFYLLSDGGTFHDITVNGIDVENAIQIVYHANIYYWTPTTDYHDAAIGTYYAAMDLDPTGAWADEVAKAWRAVEVDFPDTGLAFNYPLGNPRTIPYRENTLVEVEVSGLVGGTPIPGTGQIHYFINGGSLITEALSHMGDNIYHATLPALGCGSTLEYYFSAQEAGGERFYDPDIETPYAPVVVDELLISFADNFEADLGWTVYGNAIAGHWERGIPVSENTNGPVSDFDGSGQCYLTGNAEGDSDVDNGITHLMSPVFDLNGADGAIKFATWYDNRCYDGQIAGDMLYTWISNDDGFTWSLAEVVGPNPYFEEVWQEHEFVVSDVITPTSQMRLRFEIGDTGLPTCTEAAVDAVEVTKFVCQSYICGDASNDGNVNILDATFLISFLYKDGPPPIIPAACDANGDGNTNILDITYLIAFLYKDGPEPNCL